MDSQSAGQHQQINVGYSSQKFVYVCAYNENLPCHYNEVGSEG